MKRRNATRNALFTSIISMLLCVSMLVGTTFAWFTDEVESGRNTIAAGNLDVELYANDVKVDSTTKLFDDVNPSLWEPGAVAYENLLVKNVGSLALQYSLTLDVLNETVVNGYKLSDVIKVGVVNEKITSTDRNEVIGKVTEWTKLSEFKLGMNALKLEAGQDSGDFAVILYWQPNDNDTDNHYNMNNENQGKVLQLEIGVSLIATQVVHEFDSFGDDYDSEATPWIGAINTDWYFEDPTATNFVIDTVDELAGLAAIVNGTATAPVTTYAVGSASTVKDSFKGKTITLGANIDLANSTWTPIGNSTNKFQGTFDGAGYTISNLKVTGNGNYVGLFGFTVDGEIKNLTVENASVSGRVAVGVVAGSPYTSKYTNITVKGHVEVNGMAYVGGVGGRNAYANWTDVTVNVDATSYVKALSTEDGSAYRTYVGGVVGFNGEGGHTFKNITSNIDVIGDICDIGGVFGIAHYGNNFENITCTGNVSCTGEADELGGIAGVWNNASGYTVTMNNVSFTGTVSDVNGTVTGCDIVGGPYGAGNGQLIIDGNVAFVVASDAAALKDALKNGAENIDANGANLGNLNYGLQTTTVPAGKTLTISNATFEGKSYGNAVDGTVIFENCTFTNTGAYSIHFDAGKGDVIFKNCTLYGWNSFGASLNSVSFYDCTLYGNGTYALIRSYVNLHVENCLIDTTNANHNDAYSEGVEAVSGATLTESNNTYVVTTAEALQAAITNGSNVMLPAGEYKMPSSSSTGEISITGTKDAILDMTMGAYMDSATVTIEGVTIKTSTGKVNGNGSDYAALYTPNVTYKNCTFVGPMRVGRDGAKFINCTFTELGNDYVWTYGNDVTFENCTFNTDGKAILVYSDGGNEVAKVTVKNCVFNSTQGAKAGAIANQNCAAIEIHNYGNGVNLVTEGNTYDSNFSGEWRIKTYESGKPQVIVNGTEYTTIALDGKTMTIDANKNVTVNP